MHRRWSEAIFLLREVLRLQVEAECCAHVAYRVFRADDPAKEIEAIRNDGLRRRVRVAYRRIVASREKQAA